MKDITNEFGTYYYPKAALVFYDSNKRNATAYVECFDMDKDGHPVNAHPLTVREANRLAKALNTETEKKENFLKPKGILDPHVLYTDAQNWKAIWFTKGQQKKLYFTDKLGIPNGIAHVPPLLWKADREALSIFALKSNKRPTANTSLFHAPLFNVYESGNVCMGTVDVSIKQSACLEEFITAWERYFFDSYFSHLMEHHNPVEGNCVLLWEGLIDTGKSFPMEVLKPTTKTLKNLLS